MKVFSLSLLILSALTACVDSSLPSDSEPVEIHISYSQNLSARFNAKFSNATPDSISWKFGDGYQGIGNSISHKYLSPGNYTGTLSYLATSQKRIQRQPRWSQSKRHHQTKSKCHHRQRP